jgi:glycosyltransferase involved in cell wall biosynthesis
VHQEARAEFVWVGDGPLEGELRPQVRRLRLDTRVHFLGRRADVPGLLAGPDVLVLPSLFEGLPLAVLEAMPAGVPVVPPGVTGTTEAIEDGATGRLVPPGDPAALAAGVVES